MILCQYLELRGVYSLIKKCLLTAIIVIHGLIHLMGGVNETGLAEVEGLAAKTLFPMPFEIQVIAGVFWFIAVILFVFTAFGLITNRRWWKTAGIIAVICSQILILIWWPAAKWGTIPNILVIFSIYLLNFDALVRDKVKPV